MWRTNTSQVGESGLFLRRLLRPRADALLNVVGERAVLAEAIRICIVLAFGEREPRLQTAG